MMIQVLSRDLIKVFNGNRRWKATDLDINEATLISIAIASLKLTGGGQIERFIADIGDIIRAKVKQASNMDLINLAKTTFYMRGVGEHNKDLYSHVHAECISRYNLRKLEEVEKEALKRIFSEHGIMKDSPFAGAGGSQRPSGATRVER